MADCEIVGPCPPCPDPPCEVALTAETLAALETITVANFPPGSGGGLTDAELRATPVPIVLDAAALAALESITVAGTVALDAGTLAALETISLDPTSLAALETISLDATTLAALEDITVSAINLDTRDLTFLTDKVDASGSSVSVTNFPATQPISGTVEIANDAGNPIPVGSGLVPEAYDFIDIGYDGSNRLSSVVYKTGGSGGTTVATLTLVYIGTSTRIDTVTRS